MFCAVGKNVFDGLIIEFGGTRHRELILTSPWRALQREGPSLANSRNLTVGLEQNSPLLAKSSGLQAQGTVIVRVWRL